MDHLNTLFDDFPILDFDDIAINVNESEPQDLLDTLLHQRNNNTYDQIASQQAAQDINEDLIQYDLQPPLRPSLPKINL